MRHQFIGGPLDGKIKLILSEEDATSIPWESYIREAEVASVDGVMQTLVWRHRVEATTSQTIDFAAMLAESVAEDDVIKIIPPLAPADGGYDTVKASLTGTNRPPIDLTQKERLQAMQADAESRITGAALRDAGYMGPVDENASMNASPAMIPDAQPEPTVVGEVTSTENSIVVTGPEMGDYGTLDGESIWETFEARRKKVKGFPRWQWGGRLKEGGSSSLGDRLEAGKITPADVKKLGADSTDEIYNAADSLLRNLGV